MFSLYHRENLSARYRHFDRRRPGSRRSWISSATDCRTEQPGAPVSADLQKRTGKGKGAIPVPETKRWLPPTCLVPFCFKGPCSPDRGRAGFSLGYGQNHLDGSLRGLGSKSRHRPIRAILCLCVWFAILYSRMVDTYYRFHRQSTAWALIGRGHGLPQLRHSGSSQGAGFMEGNRSVS